MYAGIILLGLILSRNFHHHAVQAKTFDPRTVQLYPLPPSGFLRISSLGFRSVLADYFWIKIILKMGASLTLEEYEEHLQEMHQPTSPHPDQIVKKPTQKDTLIVRYLQKTLEPRFFEYIDRITDIDPKFAFPYMTGFTFEMFHYHQKDKAVYFLKKAMKNVPEYWEFPFYYSFYLFFFEHAPDSVIVPYLVRSVKAPSGVRVFDRSLAEKMLQTFVRRMNRDIRSRMFLYSVFESLGDNKLKEKFLRYLQKEGVLQKKSRNAP
jgi:hypothetical protein